MKTMFNCRMKITQTFGNDFFWHFDDKKYCEKDSGCKRPDCHLYYLYSYGFNGHIGIDCIPSIKNDNNVYSVFSGIIIYAQFNESYGNRIVIFNEQKLICDSYSHLKEIAPEIKKGIHVNEKDLIGIMGNTGASMAPHVHYEIMKVDKYARKIEVNKFSGMTNPVPYLI